MVKNTYLRFKQFRRKLAVPLMIIPFFFWFYAIMGASNAGFVQDELDVQIMVISGSISMLIGAVAALWE